MPCLAWFIKVIWHLQALQDAIGPRAARDHEGAFIKMASHMNATLILIGILGFVVFAMSLGCDVGSICRDIPKPTARCSNLLCQHGQQSG